MRHEELAEKECAIARTWAVIGERWTMMILRECFRGVRRFEDIQAKLQLGRNILTDRLQLLVHEGVLDRRPYQERPTRYEYVLTQKGEDLLPVLLAMLRWENRYKVDDPPLQLMHKTCGHSSRRSRSARAARKNGPPPRSARLLCRRCLVEAERHEDGASAVSKPALPISCE